jgi:hypothetical protein
MISRIFVLSMLETIGQDSFLVMSCLLVALTSEFRITTLRISVDNYLSSYVLVLVGADNSASG